ncbi:ABC transporter ATP-binding protein [Rhizobium sp. BE258]|uniref:ABC transporter ATP-binding protein n=1 Tax=Rhizobium sp. BE258 TaxID=2817722 RepID=UPI00285E41FA|nr:ABC transporter ATP-binding protein [Rhizobium sp. BE258]MDR7144213.1 ABC-type nitrate/sulfonate/bicarbonate transport system ATPase subunit [Rhizobium sp. BE258]
MSDQPLLDIRDLSCRLGTVAVLDGISLQLHAGEFVSILGPSGAGKSTLFRILTGSVAKTGGSIRMNGNALDSETRPFAFMPQRDALMPWRRLLANAALGLEMAGMSRRDASAEITPLLAEFGLEGFERSWPHELSGGMRQRVALLRTVVQQRPILLLDEPFGALDALTRLKMQRFLEALCLRRGLSVILITHDVREAVLLSDRIYLFSPRPARIVLETAVRLPRPRTEPGSQQTDVIAIENRILATLFEGEDQP